MRVLQAALLGCGVVCAMPGLAETPEERGEYLVTGPMGCGNCHSPMGPDGFLAGQELSGRLFDQSEAYTIYAPNITPAGAVARWSDADLARTIREGIRPDGSLVGPPMPFAMYRGLSDTDLAAIVAYLRTVPAVESDVPKSTYHIPLPPAWGPPVDHVADVPRGVSVAYGAYLAGPVAHCLECHTPMGPEGPNLATELGRGGFEFRGPWGTSVAANLTGSTDGLANYTDAEIAAMITRGLRPDGSAMLPPMPYPFLAKMAPEDLAALILYLRSLPPLPDAG